MRTGRAGRHHSEGRTHGYRQILVLAVDFPGQPAALAVILGCHLTQFKVTLMLLTTLCQVCHPGVYWGGAGFLMLTAEHKRISGYSFAKYQGNGDQP
jgi:hypothetical protein